MRRYYPPIKRALQETGYPFSSIDDGRLPLESRSSPLGLERCLTFMLCDHFGWLILRGTVSCSLDGFLFNRAFFLEVPRSTNPAFLFRIIADEASAGIEGRQWTLDQAAIGTTEETITTSVEMYESTIDGFETMADVEECIALARRCLETS